jgi:voltage-gated potassium channel
MAFISLIIVVGGGILYNILASYAGEPDANIFESFYQVLALTFLQPIKDFPTTWYLEIFYFVMPMLGIIILAQGIADFGIMLFNRRARGKEWEAAVASLANNHVILVGLGHLGYRVAQHLFDLEQEVVVIELNPKADLVESVKKLGIPVIEDDASREVVLESAGVSRARAIINCTQNDSLNLQVALKARRMNPSIQVVLRIFDEDFAQALQDQFHFTAFSATSMAAPAFASAAAGVDMTRPIMVEGESLSLARLRILSGSPLCRISVGEVERRYNISVVLLRRDHESDLHPPSEALLMENDWLGILGTPPEISLLVQENGQFNRKWVK